MDKRIIKITALVFLALAVIVAYPWLREKLSGSKTETPNSISLSGFTKDTVSKIVIAKGSDEKNLNFKDNKWFIGDDEADENKVDQFFQNLHNLKTGTMVSQNEDNQGKFNVTKDNPDFKLTLSQNGQNSVFLIGKSGIAINDFYIRKEGIKNVYLVNGELRNALGWSVDQWKKTATNKK